MPPNRDAENIRAALKAAGLGLTGREVGRYSLCRSLNAAATQNWTKAGFELECSTAAYAARGKQPPGNNAFAIPFDVLQRDLTVATASQGGYLVETQNTSFIELLRNRSVCLTMGASRLTGLQGNISVPRQTAAATPAWLTTEASTATESQPTFGQLTLTPKTCASYCELSRLLMLQSNPAAESLVMNDLAKVVALAVDQAALAGSGASGQPLGIVNTAGIGAFTGASLGLAALLDAQTDVLAGDAVPESVGYVTTPTVAGLLMARQRFASTDTPLWSGSMLDGQVCGFRGMSSNQMASATMIFGDWSQLIIAEWGILEVEVNPYANFQAGISGVRAMYTVDVGVRRASAFSLATSIT